MLDPIRAYAARRLAEAGEEQAARNRHVAWSAHALERAHLGPDGRPVTLSLYALDPLAGELRAALRWCATGGSARAGLGLAGGLDQWWRERGLAREGRLWLFRLYGRIAETASGSRRESWRRRTTCTRCTPARTVSSPRSCASPSAPRRRPGRPATPGCSPGCSLVGPRRWSTWGSSSRPSGCAVR